MATYYNEIDPLAAEWLRNLISAGLILDGEVDERDIKDVEPNDLKGFTQCHFFAGLGGWSYALRLAGWPDGEPVWTGSCPCQPFSNAGQHKGDADKRHLWPAFCRLIAERRPATVFGEQVASGLGREWLAGVRADLEALGYAVGAADLCAAGVGAPHIRQRLYWVADSSSEQEQQEQQESDKNERRRRTNRISGCGMARGLAFSEIEQHDGRGNAGRGWRQSANSSRMGNAPSGRRKPLKRNSGICVSYDQAGSGTDEQCTNGTFIECLDGKARRAEPGVFPLVDGLPRGMVPSGDPGSPDYANATAEALQMRLRGYGNAIVPQIAAVFIRAAIDCGIR